MAALARFELEDMEQLICLVRIHAYMNQGFLVRACSGKISTTVLLLRQSLQKLGFVDVVIQLVVVVV